MAHLKTVLEEFRGIFERSKGLIDFPALQFAEILMELGEHLPEDEGFDETFESALIVARERESSVVSGRMLLRRGIQKLKGKRPYEAIRLLGRAQQDLALHESRNEMVSALGLCASAYEAVGLLWAARGCLLLAASQALKSFLEHGKITVQALTCVRKLVWLELQLGRIPCALAWIEVLVVLDSALEDDPEREIRLKEEWMHLDRVFGGLLLKTDIFELKDLAFLPAVLEQFHLDAAWMALLYALGYEDRLRAEKAIPADETSEAVLAFFNSWVGQPSLNELPELPQFLDKGTIELRSSVLGCDLRVTLPNNNRSLFLAEAILAGLEGFLATSLDSPLVPHTSRFQLRIVPRDFMSEPLTFNVIAGPQTIIEINHPKDEPTSADSSTNIQDSLAELISTVTAHIAIVPDEGLKFLEGLIKNERGFGRALLITDMKSMIGNVVGDSPKFRISDWNVKRGERESFPLLRKEAWNYGTPRDVKDREPKALTPGKGDPPPGLFETERLKHGDRRVFSLINFDLWDKASWNGTGFATAKDPSELPSLMVLFKDLEAATHIFEGWRKELGQVDTGEKLRVSVITGIDRDNPFSYRVVISANPNWSGPQQGKEGTQFIVVSRIMEMKPSSSANLDRFLEAYSNAQQYLLMPAQGGAEGITTWAPRLGIVKRELLVRPAWQIGRHDPDICAIEAGDKIVVPEGVSDAPVFETLAWKKEMEKKARSTSSSSPPIASGAREKIGRNDPCYCGSGKKYKKCHGR